MGINPKNKPKTTIIEIILGLLSSILFASLLLYGITAFSEALITYIN